MNRLRNPPNNQEKTGAGPYQELFIYYLKGRLKADDKTLPDNCIGNWEEEEDSFLFFSRPAFEQVENLLSRQPQLGYIDSYHMPYGQWLGEDFSTFEHGKFRVIPPWEGSHERNNTNGEKLYSLWSIAQRSTKYCQYPCKTSGHDFKSMDQ